MPAHQPLEVREAQRALKVEALGSRASVVARAGMKRRPATLRVRAEQVPQARKHHLTSVLVRPHLERSTRPAGYHPVVQQVATVALVKAVEVELPRQ